MSSPRPRSFVVYLAVVSAAGICVLVLAAVRAADPLRMAPAVFWLISALLLVAELFPIVVPRKNDVDEITVSTSFGFALTIAFGVAPAIAVQGVASIIADLVQRKSWWKVTFDAAAYSLSLGAAGMVYDALGGGTRITSGSLAPAMAAGFVFVVLNVSVVSVGIALAQGLPLLAHVGREIVFDAYSMPVLLALSPVIVVVADRSPWLVILAAAPVVAVHWGTKMAAENSRLVARLRGSLDEMTELNRMKDEFVAVVSHELRTPLTSIQGYIKTLLQLSTDLEAEQRVSFLQAADRQSDRLRRLIEQLLVVARIESDVEPLATAPVSLQRLVALVVDELRPRTLGHVFDVRIPSDLDEVHTDEGKLHQIVSNLAENALKYSPPDSRVVIRVEAHGDGTVLTVQDEGRGIPDDSRDLIFDRFYQVDQSSTRRVGGTGLGLYICRRMADAIGARLWLSRSDEDGSEFHLSIPTTPPEAEERSRGGEQRGLPQSITASV